MPGATLMTMAADRLIQESENGGPDQGLQRTEKRQITRNRTSYSCQNCRKRKVKCDKLHPSCSGCLKSGDVCAYGKEQSPPPIGSGLTSNGSKRRSSAQPSEISDASHSRISSTPGNVIIHGLEQQLSRLADLVETMRRESAQSASGDTSPSPDSHTHSTSRDENRGRKQTSTLLSTDADALIQKAGELSRSLADLDIAKTRASYVGKGRENFWGHLAEELKQLQYLVKGSSTLPAQKTLTEAMGIEHTDCNRPRERADPDALIDDALDMHPYQLPDSKHPKDDCWTCRVRSGDKSALLMPRRLKSMSGHAEQMDLLAVIPTETQSNVLFRAWMSGVYPALPVIPMRISLLRYQRFWKWQNAFVATAQEIDETADMYFLPILFAIWYTGALSLSTKAFEKLFPNISRAEVCARYHDECIRALAMVSFPSNTQPYLLAALVMLQSVPCAEEEPLESSAHISLLVRVAQSMGMHREPTLQELNPFDAETRRRVWWQIVQLDTSLAVSSGFPASLMDATADVRLISQVKEMFIDSVEERVLLNETETEKLEPVDDPFGRSISVISVAARVSRAYSLVDSASRKLIAMHMRTRPVGMTDLKEMNEIVAATEAEVHAVIGSIPVKGVPELGFIPVDTSTRFPSQLDCDPSLEAAPTDAEVTFYTGLMIGEFPPSLNRFHRQRTAAFHKWARIWLSMMCDKLHCIAYAPFLKNLKSKLWGGGRQCALHHCSAYLRKFLSLVNDPSLEPFRWNWPGRSQPMHAAIILLVDLYERPRSVEAARSRALIDEVFSLSAPINGIVGTPLGNTFQRPFREGGGDAWEMIRNLRATAWRKAGLDPNVLWTEEQQILVGVAQPLTMEQKVARSMREDTLYDNSTRETADTNTINAALLGLFDDLTSTDYKNLINQSQMADPTPRNPIRLPGQQPMPFPLLRKQKAQLTTQGTGASAHIDANRYNGTLPEEMQDHNTMSHWLTGGQGADSSNNSNATGLTPESSAGESPGNQHPVIEAYMKLHSTAQSVVDPSANASQHMNNGSLPQARHPVSAPAEPDQMDFEFDWDAWDTVFNQYSGYSDFMDDIPTWHEPQ